MAIYRFESPSQVDAINFVRTEKGGMRGYMQATPNTTPEQLNTIIEYLREKKLEAIPFMLNHHPTLEVRGFKKENTLVKMLTEGEFIEGKPSIEKTPEDNLTVWQKLRKRTLEATGWTYAVGDYGFFTYGMKEADHLVMAGAVSYFLGTLALVFYGRNDQSDLQVHDMAKDLEQFLAKEKVQIPEGTALHKVAQGKDQTLLQSLNEFGKRYPSEMFNSVTALAGVFVAASAYRNKIRFKPTPGMDATAIREMIQEGWMDFGLGTITAASGTLATLVKEKKPDPDDPPAKGTDWVWQKVQEHPLAISGAGYMAATMCHAGSTVKAYREAKRVGDAHRLASVPRRALFVGMALISELLLMVSSKGHGDGVTSDDSVDKSVYAMAAELITKQPPEHREWHIQHIAGFLQQPTVMAEAYTTVEKTLREQVHKMEKNPWAAADGTKPQAVPVQPAPQPVPQTQPHQPRTTSLPTSTVQAATLSAQPAAISPTPA